LLTTGGEIVTVQEDYILAELRKIVGPFWASNDPAIGIAYHHDLCPHVDFKMPQYVVMPHSKEEIASIIKLLNYHQIPYVVRGNGASTHGLVFTEGVVLDLQRMKTIDFDEKNWLVKAGPGVAAFELQSAAAQLDFRVHTAEPAALVCANIMTSGLLSTFSTTYGISADNFIDAEFVARDGSFFSLNDLNSPNLFYTKI
jgi:FAD/FMN-containing dehydrogenase